MLNNTAWAYPKIWNKGNRYSHKKVPEYLALPSTGTYSVHGIFWCLDLHYVFRTFCILTWLVLYMPWLPLITHSREVHNPCQSSKLISMISWINHDIAIPGTCVVSHLVTLISGFTAVKLLALVGYFPLTNDNV